MLNKRKSLNNFKVLKSSYDTAGTMISISKKINDHSEKQSTLSNKILNIQAREKSEDDSKSKKYQIIEHIDEYAVEDLPTSKEKKKGRVRSGKIQSRTSSNHGRFRNNNRSNPMSIHNYSNREEEVSEKKFDKDLLQKCINKSQETLRNKGVGRYAKSRRNINKNLITSVNTTKPDRNNDLT